MLILISPIQVGPSWCFDASPDVLFANIHRYYALGGRFHGNTISLHWLGLQLWFKVSGVAKSGELGGNGLPPPQTRSTLLVVACYLHLRNRPKKQFGTEDIQQNQSCFRKSTAPTLRKPPLHKCWNMTLFRVHTSPRVSATLLPMPEVGVKLDVLRLSLVMPWGD